MLEIKVREIKGKCPVCEVTNRMVSGTLKEGAALVAYSCSSLGKQHLHRVNTQYDD